MSSDAKLNGSVAKKEKAVEPTIARPLILEKGNNLTTTKKKEKRKKKKQKHKEQTTTNTVVKSDPTSTTDIPDYSRFV